jgi:hypothetical protein
MAGLHPITGTGVPAVANLQIFPRIRALISQSKMATKERSARSGLEITLKGERPVFFSEGRSHTDKPRHKLRGVRNVAAVVFIQPLFQMLSLPRVVLFRMGYGLKNVYVVVALHRVINLPF